MRYSLPPGNDLMVQHTAPSSGTYLHWPGECNSTVQYSLKFPYIAGLDSHHSFRLGFGLRNILTYCCLEFRGICIIGNRNHDLDIVGGGPPLELGLGLHHDLHPASTNEGSALCGVWTNQSSPGVCVALYAGLHPDEGLDVGVEAVGHQLELSVRRDEGDRAVVLEPGQSEDSEVFESKHL